MDINRIKKYFWIRNAIKIAFLLIFKIFSISCEVFLHKRLTSISELDIVWISFQKILTTV